MEITEEYIDKNPDILFVIDYNNNLPWTNKKNVFWFRTNKMKESCEKLIQESKNFSCIYFNENFGILCTKDKQEKIESLINKLKTILSQ